MRNEGKKNSHRGGAKSGSHENSVRSGTARLRTRVVVGADEGRVKLESHCSGCDFGGELWLCGNNQRQKECEKERRKSSNQKTNDMCRRGRDGKPLIEPFPCKLLHFSLNYFYAIFCFSVS